MSRTLWMSVLLVVATLAVYAQVVTHEFVSFDDHEFIVYAPGVADGLTWHGVEIAFARPGEAYWHPATTLSYMLSCELFGLDAGRHVLLNVLLHAATAVLLFAFLRMTTGAFWPCAFVAAVFALHPLNVEAVAWATARKDNLSGFFWILTLLAWAWYARRPRPSRYLAAALTLALGLLAKPMLVTVPLQLLLLDLWPLRRWRGSAPGASGSPLGRLALEKVPLLLLSLASAAVTAATVTGAAKDLLPSSARLANALNNYAWYALKLIWPGDLAFFYPHPALVFPESRPWTLAILSALALAGVTVVVVRWIRERPHLAVGWFWYVGMLLPVSSLIQVGTEARADRRVYLPLVGLLVMIAWSAEELARRRPRVRRGLALAAVLSLVGLGTTAWFQVRTWKDDRALYGHALRVTERNFVAHANLGTTLLNEGDLEGAEEHLRAALAIRDDLHVVHNDLGLLLARARRLAEAQAAFERATEIRPGYAEAHNNLGVTLKKRGRTSAAIAAYRRAARLDPHLLQAANSLALMLASTSDTSLRDAEEALRWARHCARATGYEHPAYLETLAAACAEAGDFQSAVRWQQEALKRLLPPRRQAARGRLDLFRDGRPLRVDS